MPRSVVSLIRGAGGSSVPTGALLHALVGLALAAPGAPAQAATRTADRPGSVATPGLARAVHADTEDQAPTPWARLRLAAPAAAEGSADAPGRAPCRPAPPATPTAPGQAPAPGEVRTQAIPGTDVSFETVFVPAGELSLGSPPDEADRDADEGPVRRVGVSAFWMGRHEVTQSEYALFRNRALDSEAGPSDDRPFAVDAVTRPTPPYDDPAHGMAGEGHPAVGMTRRAALHYARWLSEKTGRLYRLPTEAEWEYACRAGGSGAWGFGDDPSEAVDHAWLARNSGGTLHPVGLKAPNAWGLADMHGNAAEWVVDGYDADFHASLPADAVAMDPVAGDPGRGRGVVRGGAFDDEPAGARCAARQPESAAWKRRDPQIPKSGWWNTDSPHVGFRLVSPARAHTSEEMRAYWTSILGG